MTKLVTLANKINAFDTFYEMSDSNLKWELGKRQEESIKAELNLLSDNEIRNLQSELGASGKANYQRYFKTK